MGLILQVGESKETVKPPKDFPVCNNFKQPINPNYLTEHENNNCSLVIETVCLLVLTEAVNNLIKTKQTQNMHC